MNTEELAKYIAEKFLKSDFLEVQRTFGSAGLHPVKLAMLGALVYRELQEYDSKMAAFSYLMGDLPSSAHRFLDWLQAISL